MAFNPNDHKIVSTSSRYMPVVLLLDVSGSMDGDKIENLYDATVKMIETFADQSRKEIPYKVAIITFGANVDCHTRYTDAKDLKNLSRFYANGMTPLGAALRMAKAMLEDPDETKKKWYRPAVVLVSDGYPNDDYQGPLNDFINNGRTARCQRVSMGIGDDADYGMLETFASEDVDGITGMAKFCFKAEDAGDIVRVFKLISASIQNSVQQNPNDVPGATSRGSASRSKRVADPDDDLL